MARILWKSGNLLSVETRANIFALAQMLEEPYLVFFDIFSNQKNFKNVNIREKKVIFCKAIARQFLKESNIVKLKGADPEDNLNIPKHWINIFPGSRDSVIFHGTEKEKKLPILGGTPGGQLVEKRDRKGGFQGDSIVVSSIPLEDNETIAKYETTSLGVYPELNERLYLCYLNEKNVDPMKLLYFDMDIPLEYASYIDAITNDARKLGY